MMCYWNWMISIIFYYHSIMENFKHILKQRRPNLSQASITKYDSTLRSLYKKVFDSAEYNIGKLTKSREIMEYLKNVPADKRKTILSALFVLTGNETYKEQMSEDISTYNEEVSKHKMNTKTAENWITMEEIKSKLDDLAEMADKIYQLPRPTYKQFHIIQLYVLLALQGGIYIPCRRSADWCYFKIKNIDKKVDNYFVKDTLVFNTFKTAKSHGQEIVKIPPPLQEILRKFIKFNPLEWLFFNNQMNPVSSSKITLWLNSIFGKRVGVNMLRKIFLTTKYGGLLKKQEEMAEDMGLMGSSSSQAGHYLLDT
jgi:hypothetical protein